MSISKKQALTLGVLAIGGIAAASSMTSGDGGDAGATMEGRAGRILGSGAEPEAPFIFKVPAEAAVTFPAQPDYTRFLNQFLKPKEALSRGTAGVSSAGKKVPVYSSLGYAETKGLQDLPSVFAHLPATEMEGYVKPKQITFGTGYKKTETKPYSFWAHLYSSFRGKEESYTSQYDYVKGRGMLKVITKKESKKYPEGMYLAVAEREREREREKKDKSPVSSSIKKKKPPTASKSSFSSALRSAKISGKLGHIHSLKRND